MITFKPCVTYKRRDGTYQVRIRVTFARKSRYLATTLTAYPSQLTRSLRLRDGALIASADNLIRQMRSTVADLNPFALEGRSVDWVCDYIKAKMRGSSFHLRFVEYGREWARGKHPSTRQLYEQSLAAFSRHIGGDVDINDIDGAMLRRFADSYDTAGTARRHLSRLSTIFASARKRYNEGDDVLIPRTPFDTLDLRLPASQGQRSLGVELVQRIISARPTSQRQAEALAVFVVSFGTMGANFADLWAAKKFKGNKWVYERQKTRGRRADRARMEVEIDSRLSYHIGLLSDSSEWWLGELHRLGKDAALDACNRHLKEWARGQELEEFSTYAARHSWATIGRSAECGLEKALIDECLAHIGDFKVADIYAERDWRRINEANRKVLDLFSWGVG